jgi:large subunit ribosomal protein L5
MTSSIKPINLTTNEYFAQATKDIQKKHPKLNTFAHPKISKIVINIRTSPKDFDNKQKQEVSDYLEKLTSQKPKKTYSKLSIAAFKIRKGDVVGLVVTLRNKKAEDFLMQLIYMALPRTKDFKGIKNNAFDSNMSCYSLSIDNSGIFHAIGFDTTIEFGMQINIVFKHSDPLNKELLENLNFPFKK